VYRGCTDFVALLSSGHMLLPERTWSSGHDATLLGIGASTDRDELGLGVAERVDEHARMDKWVL
jgi:hypothetical protein